MNDQAVRKVLISYIKMLKTPVRIYQEKQIGASACDVMAVTDEVIGYEIKSDLDNYLRLPKQIKAYDQFFDRNYIVVDRSHAASVVSKVPAHWGILCISDGRIIQAREARLNRNKNVSYELGMLWSSELKHILNSCDMPMFAQFGKQIIIEQIAGNVSPEEVSSLIARELMKRDYSLYDAKDPTVIYTADPDADKTQTAGTVSAQTEEKSFDVLFEQWTERYLKAHGSFDEDSKVERVPHKITYKDIEVSLGVPWISKDIIQKFVTFFADGDRWYKVTYEPVSGTWYISEKNSANRNVKLSIKYGLKKYNALYIIESSLNLREIKIHDSEGNLDEKSILTAIEKQKEIQAIFKEWLWQDEDRIWEVEESYNSMFAAFEYRKYDGSHLEFPDLNPEVTLYDYQKNAVQRIIESKNTLLAYDVGAGKTYIMITAAMIMRQRGISRKNMFVVPNNIVGQWEKIFTDLYPDARLLVIEPKRFKTSVRQDVLNQIRYGDYDGIIIAYSCFDMIPVSTKYIVDSLKKTVNEINEAIENLVEYSREMNILKQERQRIITSTHKLIDAFKASDDEVSFDQLGITTLFLDEAHNYKNLPIKTKMTNIRGINITGSVKCSKMLQKVRCVQECNNGRGVVFATGTPLCNSLADAYVMQMYLQYEDMSSRFLDTFDNWVKTFASPERVSEIDVNTSSYRIVTRFSKFFNLPELSLMFAQIADFHAMESDAGLPECSGYEDTVIDNNPALKSYMMTLVQRTENIRTRSVDPAEDNMLKVSTDGRKAALDLRLVGFVQDELFSKITFCVDNAMRIYNAFPGCSQLIFCDYSTPKKDAFNVYDEVKNKLISLGVDEKEIAFIHSYHTEERKLSLYNKVNSGEVRFLIGSTFKLGIGANVQTVLKAIHHLDVPWRPSDMVQREGRILRQGNTNDKVYIFRYVCQGSFDSYSWQILETKQKFISQFLSGTTYQRSISDLDNEVLDFAEVKALALSDPRMKLLAEKENELATCRILSQKFIESRHRLSQDEEKAKDYLIVLANQLVALDEVIPAVSQQSKESFAELKKQLTDTLSDVDFETADQYVDIVFGFEIRTIDFKTNKKSFKFTYRDAVFYVEAGDSAIGNATRIINFLQSLDDRKAELIMKKIETIKLIESIELELLEEAPYDDEISKLEKEIASLRAEMETVDQAS